VQPQSSASPAGPDWPARTAETIESVVATIRDRTVAPATLVAKAVAYGSIIALVGVSVMVMVGVAAVRVANVYAFNDWQSEAIVGGIFALLGLFGISRARAARRPGRKG